MIDDALYYYSTTITVPISWSNSSALLPSHLSPPYDRCSWVAEAEALEGWSAELSMILLRPNLRMTAAEAEAEAGLFAKADGSVLKGAV